MSLAASQYCSAQDLQVGFYANKCIERSGFLGIFSRKYDVERIVADKVRDAYYSSKYRNIVPALLRLQFHDCFVYGCDASILLDGPETEKNAPPNLSVRGYDLIDDIKDEIEKICPGIVSCADIIAMATRDAISLAALRSSREEPFRYDVETGRRDGIVSRGSDIVDLPPPTATASNSIKAFQKKGLTATDMVYLLGGHSVGVTHCNVIEDRLSNFNDTGRPDSTMNQDLVESLNEYCARNPTGQVSLDQGTPSIVDNSFYKQSLYWNKGILKVDQDIVFNEETRRTVVELARDTYKQFNVKFWQAMVKLQRVGVLTYPQGEIRQSCARRVS
ncbi:Peroxidase 60 [Morus notabilis]|uniref:Peroxidase n=1 Tax=Morus notabilis TaxID=981085 RepID=W9RSH4_9ROSA|nr:peroxidase 60 [Morus notabilis]EXB91219.1 Peroxidase 60 [Morus notabilis]